MSYIVVDVETDGPCPGLYSMVSLGAVVVDDNLDQTFFGKTRPISDKWVPEALAISKISREEHLTYPDPLETFTNFDNWIKNVSKGRPIFFSDNVAFDWAFCLHYFWTYIGNNPFGYSGRRIGDLFCGATKDMRYQWKKHRKTVHSHMPTEDAKGNAEALLYLSKTFGVKLY